MLLRLFFPSLYPLVNSTGHTGIIYLFIYFLHQLLYYHVCFLHATPKNATATRQRVQRVPTHTYTPPEQKTAVEMAARSIIKGRNMEDLLQLVLQPCQRSDRVPFVA